jgi:hypothetical protein
VRNAFNEWKVFHIFDTTRLIIDILEDEYFVENLMDMFFVNG